MSVFGSPSFSSSDSLTGREKWRDSLAPNSERGPPSYSPSSPSPSSEPVIESDTPSASSQSEAVIESDTPSLSDLWSLSETDYNAISRPTYTPSQIDALGELGLMIKLSNTHVLVPTFLTAHPCAKRAYKLPSLPWTTSSGAGILPGFNPTHKGPLDARKDKKHDWDDHVNEFCRGIGDSVHNASLPRDLHSDDMCVFLGFSHEKAIHLIQQFARSRTTPETSPEYTPESSNVGSDEQVYSRTIPARPNPQRAPVTLHKQDDLLSFIIDYLTKAHRELHAGRLPPPDDPTIEWAAYCASVAQANPAPPLPIPRHVNPGFHEGRMYNARMQALANSAQEINQRRWLVYGVGLTHSAVTAYITGAQRQGYEEHKLINYLIRDMRRRWDVVRLAGKHLDAHLKEFEQERRLLEAKGTKTKVRVVPGLGVAGETRREQKSMEQEDKIEPWHHARRQLNDLRIGGIDEETVRRGFRERLKDMDLKLAGNSRAVESRNAFPAVGQAGPSASSAGIRVREGIARPRDATDFSPSSVGTRGESPLERVFKEKGLWDQFMKDGKIR